MFFHRRKARTGGHFNPEKQVAVIRQSICTGEMSLCFVDRNTGRREEVGCIRTSADLDSYVREYHLDKSAIRREF